MATVKPENQIDHRTTRNHIDERASKYGRERRQMLKAAGLCTVCGKEPVLNKSVCFACRNKQQLATERAIFRKYNVPLPDALLLPSERILAFDGLPF